LEELQAAEQTDVKGSGRVHRIGGQGGR
jgi:hypothetical protein